MATANKALKKRAQAFADAHDLSYLKALKAVDEPLHGLRDLTAPYADSRPQSGARYFRLVKTPGSYASPYDASSYPEKKQHPIFQRLSTGVSRFKGRSEFLRTMGLRTGIIEDCGAEDIWGYRALHRAGLLQVDAPVLEPFFHHHEHGLEQGFDALRSEGRKLGVYELNFSSYLWVEKAGASYPLTLQELDGLLAGELSAAEIQAPLSGQDRVWRKSYRYRAVSKNRSPKADSSRGETQPVLQLFLEQDPRKVRYDLPEGLHWNAFDLEDIQFSRFEFLDSELSNRRNGLRLLRNGKVEQVSAHEAVLILESAEDQSREKIEIPLVANGFDDGAFYRLNGSEATDIEASEAQTGKDSASILPQTDSELTRNDRQAAKNSETVKRLMELIGDLVDPFTRTERKFAVPVVQDLVAERRGTIRELVTALRSAMNENQRALGNRLAAALEDLQDWVNDYGLDAKNRDTKDKIDELNKIAISGKPYTLEVPESPRSLAELEKKQGVAGEIFKSLGFNEEELISAQDEVANQENREVLISDVLSLCSMVVPRFDLDYMGNREIVKAVVLNELNQGAQGILQRVIRNLRGSLSEVERAFGARLLKGLAKPRSLDEASEVQDILERMKRTEELVTEYEGSYYGPASCITDQAQDLGVKLTKSAGGKYYYGNCPFHEDRDSFHAFPEEERFLCDSCGRSGDAEQLSLEWFHRNDKGWDRELDGIIEENFS